MAGCVVSFGGYNGKYHNSVHVYRPEGYVVVKPPPRSTGGSTAAGPAAAGEAAAAAERAGSGRAPSATNGEL